MNMPCLFRKLATERGQGPCAPKEQGRVPKCSPGSKWDSDTSLQTHQHHKELQRTSSASAHNKTPVLPMTEPLVETWEFNAAWASVFPCLRNNPASGSHVDCRNPGYFRVFFLTSRENHPNQAAVSYTRSKHSHGHREGPTAHFFSTMRICIQRTEVTLPSRSSLFLYLGTSKLVCFKKPQFDKLFP